LTGAGPRLGGGFVTYHTTLAGNPTATQSRALRRVRDQLHETWHRACDGAAILGWWPQSQPQPPKLIVEACGETAAFWQMTGDGSVSLIARTQLRDPQFKVIAAAALAQSGATSESLAVACAAELTLDLDLSLPVATLPALERQIRAYVEAHTPFAAGDGLAFWTIERPGWSEANVAISILPAAHVRPVMDQLSALGVSPALAVRSPQTPSRIARPVWLAAPEASWRARFARLGSTTRAGLVAVGLIAASMAANVGTAQFALWQLSEQAEIARAAQQRSARTETDARLVANHQRATLLRVQVLNQMADKLPVSTWFDRIELKDKKLEIGGNAPSAAETLRTMSAIPGLINAELTASVTRDTARNLERFRLSAEISEAVKP
jgi:Fimbrial assembly protein (PilN)